MPTRSTQSDGVTRVYLPVYHARLEPGTGPPGIELHYTGLVLPQDQADRLKGLARIDDPRALPLHLTLTLPPNWKDEPRVMRLTR